MEPSLRPSRISCLAIASAICIGSCQPNAGSPIRAERALPSGSTAPHAAPAPSGSTARAEPRARFEIYRISDDIDRFTTPSIALSESTPEPRIFEEDAPSGSTSQKTHYAFFPYGNNETASAAFVRVRTTLLNVPIPAGYRYLVQETEATSGNASAPCKGLRTYVSQDTPVVTTEDVVDAIGQRDGSSEGYVVITLSTAAAQRFEQATSEWLHRRLAIVLDGEVQTVPLVMTPITGTHMQLTLAEGKPEAAFANAQALAKRLKP